MSTYMPPGVSPNDFPRLLECWFTASDTTLEGLIADIEKWQPGDHPGDFMGVHPEVILPIMTSELFNRDWKIAICRAVQHLAITRPWRRAQLELF